MFLVSACLLGLSTKYDCGNCVCEPLLEWVKKRGTDKIIPICPEQMGGLPTPREPMEISEGDGSIILAGSGKIITSSGKDVTDNLIRGAEVAAQISEIFPVKWALLKDHSPSCGVTKIYDGSFSGQLKDGVGVTTAKLISMGIPCRSDLEPFLEILEEMEIR